MRYRVKTERSLPLPPPGWRPKTPPPPRVVPLQRPAGPFKALREVTTPQDVGWLSEPVYDRSPAGWYRMGFCA